MSVLKGGWCLTERGNCALARLYRTNTRTSVNAGKGQVSPPGLIIAQAKSGAGLAKQERRVGEVVLPNMNLKSSFAQYERQGVVLPNMNVKEGPAELRRSAPLGRHLMLGLNRQKHNGYLEIIEQYYLCKFLICAHHKSTSSLSD